MNNLTRRQLLQWLLINSSLAAGFVSLTRTPTAGSSIPGVELGKITSKDGTPIAFLRTGSGPPLVLVHGTSSDHTRWAPVLPALGEKFTVYAMERRGRGASGDAPAFSFEREFEDVVALVDSIQEPVNLLGHSYGGICCLEALLRTKHIRKLILYEPPLTSGLSTDAQTEQIDARIEALIEKGDREGALVVFIEEIVKSGPPKDLTLRRLESTWPARVATAHTISRERKAVKNYQFKAERFQAVKIPTLLLLGGDSNKGLVTSTEMVKSALFTSQLSIMAGQAHNAMVTAPDVFSREVIRFLSA
jgi:pimeloyl-ACP methyl ester carboxylesterase